MKKSYQKNIDLTKMLFKEKKGNKKMKNKTKWNIYIITAAPLFGGVANGIITGKIGCGILSAALITLAIVLIPLTARIIEADMSLMEKIKGQKKEEKYKIYYNQKTKQHVIRDEKKDKFIGSIEDYIQQQENEKKGTGVRYKITNLISKEIPGKITQLLTDREKGETLGTIEYFVALQKENNEQAIELRMYGKGEERVEEAIEETSNAKSKDTAYTKGMIEGMKEAVRLMTGRMM